VTEVESWTPPASAAPSSALAAGTSDEFQRLLAAFLLGYEGNTRTAYAWDLADWLAWLHRHGVVGDDSQTTGLDCEQLRAVLVVARQRAVTGRGAGARDLALVTLLAHNGLRIGEALAADVEDLGTERGHRVLHITRKGGRRATVALAPVTASALDDYLAGRTTGPLFTTATARRLDEPAAFRMVRRLSRVAGVDGADALSPHSFRHAFVTAALDAGVSLRDVQDAAGPADPRTTRRYDRARHSLDRHATYAVAAWLAEGV
jgi:integrase/recombinase XerD